MRKPDNTTLRKVIRLYHIMWRCWLFFVAVPLFSQEQGCGTVVSSHILTQLSKDQTVIERHIQKFFNRLGPNQQEPITLPIQAFIMNRDNGTGGINELALKEAIHTLNANFSSLSVQFSICEPPVKIASSHFFDYHSSLESELIGTYYIPNTINVYFVNSIDDGFYTGYSYLPGGPDIIVIDNHQVNKYSFSHQMGHFFGLYHPHTKEFCPVSNQQFANFGEDHLCDALTTPHHAAGNCRPHSVVFNTESNFLPKNTNGIRQASDQQDMMMMSAGAGDWNKHFTAGQLALMDYYLNRVRNYFKSCNGLTTCVLPVVSTKDIGYTYFSLNWNYQGNDTPFHFRYRQKGADQWTTIRDYSSNAITIPDLTPCTSYEYQIQRVCPDANDTTAWTNSDFITTGGCADLYPPSYGQTATEWIDRVQLGAINNTSSNNHGYFNFENLVTNIKTGFPTKIKLTPGNSDEITRNLIWNVWVDLNRDHDFLDPGEMVLQLTGTDNRPVFGYITIPKNTLSGATRMRIALNRSSSNSPNAVLGFREVEDYTLNVISAKPETSSNSLLASNQEREKGWNRNLTWQNFIANLVYSLPKNRLATGLPTDNLELFDLQSRISYYARLHNIYPQTSGFDLSGSPKPINFLINLSDDPNLNNNH